MQSNGPLKEHGKRRVAYYYDSNIGNYYYGQGHVMKPQRIRMAHQLVLGYGLYQKLEVIRPFPATHEDLIKFHSAEYATLLRRVNGDGLLDTDMKQFNVGGDCPVFDGLYEFCQLSSGGSLAAASKLNKRKVDIAINWMGGLHHAKKSKASGFCYTNDIVLGILELLKHHKRVLYVDIDVHHGDGVEEAFYTTDRVMTVSFHKHGDFFPWTGAITDTGRGSGTLYSVNVPLNDGITDESYHSVFKPIMTKVMERFEPCVVVLQCGADSLNGDILGPFNLTLKGHGECARFFRSYNVPLMMLGGGGYTPRNVARCWAYETSIAVDVDIPNELPHNDYYENFGPHYQLHINSSSAPDMNTPENLAAITRKVLSNLENLTFVPSVQMQPISDDAMPNMNDETLVADSANPDTRLAPEVMDGVIEHEAEFYDSGRPTTSRRNISSSRVEPQEKRARN